MLSAQKWVLDQGVVAPKKTVLELVREGEESIKAGRTVPYDEHFWDNVRKKGEENLKLVKPIPYHILP